MEKKRGGHVQNQWKNIFFGVIVFVLVVAIFQQGNMLINNIRSSTTVFQNKQNIEQEDHDKEEQQVNEGAQNLKEKETEETFLKNDFLRDILKKGIPTLGTAYENNGEEGKDLLASIFSMTTNIDMKDPKTILSAQIPMLQSHEEDDVEITEKEQKQMHEQLAQKPMNDEEVLASNASRSNAKRVDNKKPLVLIYHTHTTESYTSSSKNKIEYVSPWRSLDKTKNMARVGEEIKDILEKEYGIKVIHDTTLHDYPDYSASYSKSLKTIEKIVKENPSIKYVFDIHRDGLAETKDNREVYLTAFGEQQAAKTMLVVGKDNFNSDANMKFAKKIESALDANAPNIMQSIVGRNNRKYNQFVSDYASLIEVGSNLSTLEEALNTAKPIGHALGEVITELEQ